MPKVVISPRFGGFGISEAAYEKLIEWGVPVTKYVQTERNPVTGLYDADKDINGGEVIFDRDLDDPAKEGDPWGEDARKAMRHPGGRYWDTWIEKNRSHPLLVRLVEELGTEKASGPHAKLKIVDVPDDVEWKVEEYDGNEWIAEVHRTWG